tara:strand:+ start:1622 stop:2029 length:408 start_codon:yes stop_codon:yes gene_type:complete
MCRIRQLTEELTEDQTACCFFFKLSPDLFCVAGNSGYFKMVNGAWTTALGWSTKEMTSIPYIKFIHPDDVEPTRKILQLLNDHDITKFCNRYKRKPSTINEAGQVAGNDDYVSLEWSATSWNNGLTYAVARKCDS